MHNKNKRFQQAKILQREFVFPIKAKYEVKLHPKAENNI
jgi:hypothetical protein